MDLKTLITNAGLDCSDLFVQPDSGGYAYLAPGLRPEDFLTFAKADFFKADTRGLVNALSNAKRAVDCQTDIFVTAPGLDPEALDKQLGKSGVCSLARSSQSAGPLKFRFLQALGTATPGIIGRMRRMRNLLEHEYRKPRKADVSDAIDVAELFIQACKGRLRSAFEAISFGSGTSKARGEMEIAKEFYVRFETQRKPHFDVSFSDRSRPDKDGTGHPICVRVSIEDQAFVPLLKLVWQTDFDKDMTDHLRLFLGEVGISLPKGRAAFRCRIL